MDKEKAKILDNYQLYLLINSNLSDNSLLNILKKEFDSRNIDKAELARIKTKFEGNNNLSNLENSNTTELSPIFTPFLLKIHFKKIANLNAIGKKVEAKKYQLKLNIGLILQGIIIVFALLIYYNIK